MKNFLVAAALATAASTALAGSADAPIIEPEVVVDDTSGSSAGGIVVPLMLLLIVGAVVAN